MQWWMEGAMKGANLGYPHSQQRFPMNNGEPATELRSRPTEFLNHLTITIITRQGRDSPLLDPPTKFMTNNA